jgi:hypothetical protein
MEGYLPKPLDLEELIEAVEGTAQVGAAPDGDSNSP